MNIYTVPMKWYFSSRTRHRDSLIAISKFLETKGQTINSGWIYIEGLIPYKENGARATEVARDVTRAILNSEIFVLISDPEGTDMFVELGIALGKYNASPESIRIYIVGEHGNRSLMQLHPAITHLSVVKEVLEKEGINNDRFYFPNFI